MSQESKDKISKGHMGLVGPMAGRKHTQESKDKMSATKQQKRVIREQDQKLLKELEQEQMYYEIIRGDRL